MKNRFLFYSLFFTLVCWFWIIPNQVFGQEKYSTIKPALIFQFAQHITWPNENKIQNFKIGVIGNDTSTYEILRRYSSQKNIKGKNFQVRWIDKLDEIIGLQVLYVDKSKSSNLLGISQAIENKNVLLITEWSTDTKNIMLNILFDEKKKRILFEVNKANIIIEQLEMNPELLLLGGKEVDVRELYRDIKQQFEAERISVEKQKAFIESQVLEIKRQKNKIATSETEINFLKENTEQLTNQISAKEKELSKLSYSIIEQKKSMDESELKLSNQRQLSQKQEVELDRQKDMITARSMELDSLMKEGEKQKTTIIHQTSTLQSKEQIINLQKKVILIIIAFVVIFGALMVIILRFYRLRKVLSSKLEESYTTLREQHNSILELNKELKSINEMLEEKVKERTNILEERNTQLTEYAFINSHLLRAPLSQIQGLSHLLTRENLNVKDRNLVVALSKSADELDKIIKKISDLLYYGKDFSREEIEQIIHKKFHPSQSSDYRDN